jgi:hypothetical protein
MESFWWSLRWVVSAKTPLRWARVPDDGCMFIRSRVEDESPSKQLVMPINLKYTAIAHIKYKDLI